MSAKDKNTNKAKEWMQVLPILIIGIGVYLGFAPLFQYTSETIGIPAQFISSSFGAIFVIILTMYLLTKQTDLERESKLKEKEFEEKLQIYHQAIDDLKKTLVDKKINEKEVRELNFTFIKLKMITNNEVSKQFQEVTDLLIKILEKDDLDGKQENKAPGKEEINNELEEIAVALDNNDYKQIFTAITLFAVRCSNDLGLDVDELETAVEKAKETIEATNKNFAAAAKNRRDRTKYNFLDSGSKKPLNKRRIVNAIITHYVKNKQVKTIDELKEKFPDKLWHNGVENSERPLIKLLDEVEDNEQRNYFFGEPIKLANDQKVVVANQWGIGNLPYFLNYCKDKHDYNVEEFK